MGAVTGDGTNDAPALRRADVGFAMKITGTRVAQDAADILLMDDNFASVVQACMWGRNVYDSIAKFLQFQLTVNISAVSISLIGACAGAGAPLNVVQMLWVNLIMDTLGALALASEPPTDELLNRAPHGRNRGLLSYEMWCNMLGQSLYQLLWLNIILFFGAGPACREDPDDRHHLICEVGGFMQMSSGINLGHGKISEHFSVLFNVFVMMTLFNWINCRKLQFELNIFRGISNNPMFCIIWVVCMFTQVAFLEIARLGGTRKNVFLKTMGLRLDQWLWCVCIGAASMPWQVVVSSIGKALKPYCTTEDAGERRRRQVLNLVMGKAIDEGAPSSSSVIPSAERRTSTNSGPEIKTSVSNASIGTADGTPSSRPSSSSRRGSARGKRDRELTKEFSRQIERVVQVACLNLQRQDGRILFVIGRWEDAGRIVPVGKLPGTKIRDGESPADAIHRLLEIELVAISRERVKLEKKTSRDVFVDKSRRYGQLTKYLRVVHHGTLNADAPVGLRGRRLAARAPQEVALGEVSTSDRSSIVIPDCDVVVLEGADGRAETAYSWILPQDFEQFTGPQAQVDSALQRWLSLLQSERAASGLMRYTDEAQNPRQIRSL